MKYSNKPGNLHPSKRLPLLSLKTMEELKRFPGYDFRVWGNSIMVFNHNAGGWCKELKEKRDPWGHTRGVVKRKKLTARQQKEKVKT